MANSSWFAQNSPGFSAVCPTSWEPPPSKTTRNSHVSHHFTESIVAKLIMPFLLLNLMNTFSTLSYLRFLNFDTLHHSCLALPRFSFCIWLFLFKGSSFSFLSLNVVCLSFGPLSISLLTYPHSLPQLSHSFCDFTSHLYDFNSPIFILEPPISPKLPLINNSGCLKSRLDVQKLCTLSFTDPVRHT